LSQAIVKYLLTDGNFIVLLPMGNQFNLQITLSYNYRRHSLRVIELPSILITSFILLRAWELLDHRNLVSISLNIST